MSSIKSFFQSIQKSFQGPSHSTKNVAVDVHHEIIQKPFEGPISSIKNVAVDVHHENIQKPFEGSISSTKNVAVDVHHQLIDQQHLSDLLTHPRRLEAVIPVKEAQKVVDNAYHNGQIDGALYGSGIASFLSGSGVCASAFWRRAVSAAAREAAAEAALDVIPATVHGAGAVGVGEFGAASAAFTAAEAAVAVAVAPASAFILPTILMGAGVTLFTASILNNLHHGSVTVHGV